MAKNIKTSCIYVEGMHCSSCEILIEKKLLKQNGIESVDASLKDNQVIIHHKANSEVDLNKLNKDFQEAGYKFSKNKNSTKRNSLISLSPKGELLIDFQESKKLLKGLGILVLFVFAYLIFKSLHLDQYSSINENTKFWGFVLLGFIAGSSSCAALVGGVLLSMTKQWNELYIDKESFVEKATPHFLFHIGRILSFLILGGILGVFGGFFKNLPIFKDTLFFGILIIVVSIGMIILALQMLDVKWAYKFNIKLPKAITRFSADETNFKGKFMPFLSGVLTFFLPCGFTLTAMTIAFLSGSYAQSALNMFAFALGTLPVLLFISFTGLRLNKHPETTAIFNKIAGVVIILFALFNINAQLNVLGLSSLSDLKKDNNEKTLEPVEINNEGEQILKVRADGFNYFAESGTVLKSGIKTKLEVNNLGTDGCATAMAARGLFDGYIQLKPGMNYKEFVPKKGTYKLTCTMGMVEPIVITVL